MRVAGARPLRLRRGNFAPRFVVFATALAFLLQSFITQIHIHSEPVGGAVKIAATLSSAPGKTPLDHSQRDCPFCQAIAHAGAFLAPSAPPLVLSLPAACVALFVALRPVAVAAAHNWQSRAPPSR